MIPLSLLANNIPRTSFLRPETEAQTYAAAVETADTQQLEFGTKSAYNNLFRELKRQGNFQQMNVGCLLSGARTLEGSLIPFKGDAPENNNFISDDYDRKTGLLCDAVNKYLEHLDISNYGSLNSLHLISYTRNRTEGNVRYISGQALNTSLFGISGSGFRARFCSDDLFTLGSGTVVPSLVGASRGESASFDWIGFGEEGNQINTSTSLEDVPLSVYRQSGGGNAAVGVRQAFYSAGNHISSLSSVQTAIETYLAQLNEWIP